MLEAQAIARNCPHISVLRAAGSRPPIVLFPGIEGYPFAFRRLADDFDSDQPVLATQLPGGNDDEACVEYSIEEMTSVLAPQILAACPSGPIVLGGYSLGILPAFELAVRLRTSRRVALVVSFDGFAPQFYRAMKPLHGRLWAHGRSTLSDAQWRVREALARTASRAHVAAMGQSRALDERHGRARQARLQVLRQRAVMRYRPQQSITAAMLLFRAERPIDWLAGKTVDPLYGWERYVAGPIDAHTLPASHETLLSDYPNRDVIVRLIARNLDDTLSSLARNAVSR